MTNSKTMKDGKEAWKTYSGLYYVIRKKDGIDYYNLDGAAVPLAKGQCKHCQEILQSKRCGDFVECSCGKSHVDTDRWLPERHRYGGDIDQV